MPSLPERVRLVVLFGGQSAEHDISCISASHVLAAVDPGRYEVVPIGITRDGAFVAAHPQGEVGAGEDTPTLTATGDEIDPLPALTPGPGVGPVPRPAGNEGTPTVVMPILHGPNGEDGTVQGLLEVAGVPYVGAGVLASSVAMDKAMAKVVLDACSIPQVRWHTVAPGRPFGPPDARSVLEDLGGTVFVKPANMGSSIGITKVVDRHDDRGPAEIALTEAVSEARRYDDVVVIEEGVVAHELECAVLGNLEPRASVVGEVVTDAEFYDYDDKYFDGTSRTVIPAEIDTDLAERARTLAVRTFSALRCEGMARVDMFAEDDGAVMVNEVNTIPGFTPISMYPKLWEASGLGYSELIDELVRLALERHATRADRSTSPR